MDPNADKAEAEQEEVTSGTRAGKELMGVHADQRSTLSLFDSSRDLEIQMNGDARDLTTVGILTNTPTSPPPTSPPPKGPCRMRGGAHGYVKVIERAGIVDGRCEHHVSKHCTSQQATAYELHVGFDDRRQLICCPVMRGMPLAMGSEFIEREKAHAGVQLGVAGRDRQSASCTQR